MGLLKKGRSSMHQISHSLKYSYIMGTGKYQEIENYIKLGAIKLTMSDFKLYTHKMMRYVKFHTTCECSESLKILVLNKYGNDSLQNIALYLEEDLDEFYGYIQNKLL